jgi:adenylate cyclase
VPILRRVFAVGLIALAAWLIALGTSVAPFLHDGLRLANNVFYDAFYRLRPNEDRTNSDVLIIAVDQASLDTMDSKLHYGWPWPREFWGLMAQYLARGGARAVGFDIVFSETSVYQTQTGDDDSFAADVGDAKVPIVFGSLVNSDGGWGHLAPPVKNPVFGAVNVGNDQIYRQYQTEVFGKPSLAVALVNAAGQTARLARNEPFLLHYYGPYKTKDGHHTFHYVPAISVLAASSPIATAADKAAVPADLFRNKIVLIGAITVGTYDLKSSPLSPEYPGVEVQATAIENLLGGQRVTPVSPVSRKLGAFGASVLAAAFVIFPRRAVFKSIGPVLAIAATIGIAAHLFKQPDIRWLPPTEPLLAIAIATVAAFTWAYFLEDRQRRFMLKALSKVVSPAVAEQLSREPGRLALGTIRTPLTLLFTDLADFTSVTESMDVQKVGEFLNRYLGEMSDQVLRHDGTLDKYIGDAVMCFWNAPLPAVDHAARACRTALAMVRRESEILAELKAMGASKIFTRIGINTAQAAVGFVGSSHLFNYTALGDGVNLASRLEGANKIYGTRILISQSTAEQVKDQFVLRKLDVLRVKGKREPMAVFELRGEKLPGSGPDKLVTLYESAFDHYQKRQWDEAEKELLEIQSILQDDAPTVGLLKRIASLRKSPPPPDWDGVYDAKDK